MRKGVLKTFGCAVSALMLAAVVMMPFGVSAAEEREIIRSVDVTETDYVDNSDGNNNVILITGAEGEGFCDRYGIDPEKLVSVVYRVECGYAENGYTLEANGYVGQGNELIGWWTGESWNAATQQADGRILEFTVPVSLTSDSIYHGAKTFCACWFNAKLVSVTVNYRDTVVAGGEVEGDEDEPDDMDDPSEDGEVEADIEAGPADASAMWMVVATLGILAAAGMGYGLSRSYKDR